METEIGLMDVANKKSLDEFIKEYLPQNSTWKSWTHPSTKTSHSISLQKPSDLSSSDFDVCFNLIETTSSSDYKKSKDGWKPRSKKREMRLLDLKYLLVKHEEEVMGFVSIMPTYEDDYPVLYIYEIHLSPTLQRTGLGTVLINLVEGIARNIKGTEKVMLTCFTCNENAVRFYSKLGFGKDEFSPMPRVLRNGSKVEEDYVILSKAVKRDST